MPGFSLTLLLLPKADSSSSQTCQEILNLLDAPSTASAWKNAAKQMPRSQVEFIDRSIAVVAEERADGATGALQSSKFPRCLVHLVKLLSFPDFETNHSNI
jgi:hypothetical protein